MQEWIANSRNAKRPARPTSSPKAERNGPPSNIDRCAREPLRKELDITLTVGRARSALDRLSEIQADTLGNTPNLFTPRQRTGAGRFCSKPVTMTRTDADRGYQYFPAFLDLVRKRVVVVGGGAVATSKVRSLLPCGVEPLVVVAPEVSPLITKAAADGRVVWLTRGYREGDLEGATLAFAATDDRSLNARVAVEARQRGVSVLAVDDVPRCDFIAPALVRRGGLVVAISTHGRSPALARRAREWLERELPSHWGEILEVAATVRARLGPLRSGISPEQWQAALSGPVEDLVLKGQLEAAETLLWQTLNGTPVERRPGNRSGVA